ncbi:hypothetical protein IWW37_004456 [Coemansia sp. RSA 2050]|nr:hypothetical protein IWW37_004456 [Coemansia sp. RSA 2050]KAJ2731323.1 hypothetical protein IW152_004628 [Coemansia sp. BCRC 34962]
MRTEAYRIRQGLIVKYAFLDEDEIHDYVSTGGQFMIVKHTFHDHEVYKIIKDFFNATTIPDISDIRFGFVNTRTCQKGWRFRSDQPHYAPDYLYYLNGVSQIPPDELLPLLDVSDTSIAFHFGVDVS